MTKKNKSVIDSVDAPKNDDEVVDLSGWEHKEEVSPGEKTGDFTEEGMGVDDEGIDLLGMESEEPISLEEDANELTEGITETAENEVIDLVGLELEEPVSSEEDGLELTEGITEPPEDAVIDLVGLEVAEPVSSEEDLLELTEGITETAEDEVIDLVGMESREAISLEEEDMDLMAGAREAAEAEMMDLADMEAEVTLSSEGGVVDLNYEVTQVLKDGELNFEGMGDGADTVAGASEGSAGDGEEEDIAEQLTPDRPGDMETVETGDVMARAVEGDIQISDKQLEAALERVIRKMFSEKIENLLVERIEEVVTRDMNKLRKFLREMLTE